MTGCIDGVSGGTGTVKSERMLSRVVESPFWTGPLRSPNRLQNTFAHECIMDELAARAKADPVEYRLRHLRDPRLMGGRAGRREGRELADATVAAEPGTWNPEPGICRPAAASPASSTKATTATAPWSPKSTSISTPASSTVKRLVMALDSGPISNPDGLRNQAEGGALHGMSRALFEEVTWDDEKVTSVDWRTYRTFPVGFKIPTLETVLINTMDAEANGAGETSITVTAAAIGNAIFDATGRRIRQVPFTPDRVKAALGAD